MDTWMPLVTAVAGALIAALASLAATVQGARQRREEREAAERQRQEERGAAERERREEREAAERQRQVEREAEVSRAALARANSMHELLRADVMAATSGALSLAADIANRPAPRWKYVTPEQQAAFQDRTAEVGKLLATVAILFPGDEVADAAKDTALKISRSLGTLADRPEDSVLEIPERPDHVLSPILAGGDAEDQITRDAVASAEHLLDAVRLKGLALIL